MILSIHGGPHGAYGTEFSFYFQWMAANGFAVLYTNPRGSTEYGEPFLWGTWGGWGGVDYEDVMAGVDHVLSRFDPDERDTIQAAVRRAADASELFVAEGIERVMNTSNAAADRQQEDTGA